MGALYYLKQKLVDFANVIQENVSRTDTVPSSKVVYDGLNSVNDSITGLVKWASFSYAYSIDNNASLPVSGTSLGLTIPSGYTAMAIKSINTNNGNVVPRAITAPSQSSYDVCILKNLASSTQTGTLNVAIMFIKSSSVSTV